MKVYKDYRTCQLEKAMELGELCFWWAQVVESASKARDNLGIGASFRNYTLLAQWNQSGCVGQNSPAGVLRKQSISSLITYIQQQPLGPLGMGMKLRPLCEKI